MKVTFHKKVMTSRLHLLTQAKSRALTSVAKTEQVELEVVQFTVMFTATQIIVQVVLTMMLLILRKISHSIEDLLNRASIKTH